MNLNITEKRTIFQILILIMKADLITKPEEIAFLDKVFRDFGLSIEEFDHTDNLDIDYLIGEYKLFSDSKKEMANRLFLEMAKCDGHIDQREMNIIEKMI